MKYTHLTQLEVLVAERLVSKRPHPTLPLYVYNYTAAAQCLPMVEWGEALRDARGLILDDGGYVVGRPFKKFWNYETVLAEIPTEPFTVWEKVDGSLGVVCEYDGCLVVATRGSFESEQALWAGRQLDKVGWRPGLGGFTWLFELVFPANRIVVDYGDVEEMVLLAVLQTETGRDADEVFYGTRGFRQAKRYDGMSVEALKELEGHPEHVGAEGFVVRWSPSGFRAKVKFDEYKRLHRLITQVSSRTIWELLRGGKDTQELLDRVPGEFEGWVRGQIEGLEVAFETIKREADAAFLVRPRGMSRKEFAEWAKGCPFGADPGLLFALLDEKPVEDRVWRMVEPRWVTPFRRGDDE